MSFHDGTSVGSIFDEVDTSDIVNLLEGHNIHVGPSIHEKREYLYYFIGNCNVAQQEALRNEGISRYRQTEQLCAKLCTPLLLCLLKTNHPDVSMPRQPSRYDLLKELKKYDLAAFFRDSGWDNLDPIFVDGSSVAAMIRPHRKEVIVDALRSVCPTESISSDLLRENRATISMFCSLLHGDAFQNFRDYLQDDLQPPTFPDGGAC
ncbi:hypothetical protein EDD18DRAFT_1455480 [Armillaria luteobubalina]|uniref:Uncharacterized protein n=1 Tax=Armillaria luteobubalina TaxID=153913 RepID=A0AA39QQW7_9AGAR|nr:hypothetical protein EDD18DRAFT_1455480 [Armillaria luteobubalina]